MAWSQIQKPPTRKIVIGIVGALLIVFGIVFAWFKTTGIELPYPYVLAKMIAAGRPAYAREAQQTSFTEYVGFLPNQGETDIFYPPSTGIVLIPLALFPFPQAVLVWFALSMTLLLAGAWQMSRIFAPHWSVEARLITLGVLLNSSSVRWGTYFSQVSPVVLGLLLLFLTAMARKHYRAAFGLALIALCLKLTLALPFIGLPLLKRQFRMTAALILLWAIINVLGFARVGGVQAFDDYRASVQRIESVYWPTNSANPHVASVSRTDLPYLLNGISLNEPQSRFIGYVATLSALLWLLWAGRRAAPICAELDTMGAFLAPLVSLTLLGTYHHYYDANLLLAPVLVTLFRYQTLGRLPGGETLLIAVVLYAVLSPGYQLEGFVDREFGEEYVFLPRMLGSATVLVSLIASLIVLHHYLLSLTPATKKGSEDNTSR